MADIILEEHCRTSLEKARDKWTPPKPQSEFLDWASKQFEVDFSTPVPFKILHDKYEEQMKKAYKIYKDAQKLELIQSESEQDLDLTQKFADLFQIISFAYHSLEGSRRCLNLSLDANNRLENYLPPETLVFWYANELLKLSQCNEVQQIILHVLNELYIRGYRRYHDKCYEEISTFVEDAGKSFATRAWKPVEEISTFVLKVCRKELQSTQWLNLTRSPMTKKHVIEYLKECVDPEFPELKPNRHIFSFSNGIYDAHQMAFFKYYNRDNDQGVIGDDITACNYFDMQFPDEFISGFPDKYEDWYDIPTTTFQSILDYQMGSEEEKDDICRWLYVFIGRLLYDVNEMDHWQLLPFIKGIGGSGKSTIGKHVKRFYDPQDTAVLSSNFEKKFGLSQIFDKLLFVCFEVKKDMEIAQADLQSIISGEPLSLARKFNTAQTITWSVPGLFIGNDTPTGWVDSQNSMTRRCLVWMFQKNVKNSDPMLEEKLKKEMPYFILKCNIGYRLACHLYGSTDFWEIPDLPQYFKNTKKKLQKQINPLVEFLSDEDLWEINETRYTHFGFFGDEYRKWVRKMGYRNVKFDEDHYEAVFEERGIIRQRDRKRWGDQGNYILGEWLFGIGFNSGNPPDQFIISNTNNDANLTT